jgi:pilus assembly protein Flp/PilA
MMTEFLAFLSDETGASSAEYALILAIVGGAIAMAAMSMGGAIGTSVNNMADCIETKAC